MALKNRFLQISDVMMFEYIMHDGESDSEYQNLTSFIYTKLKDGHTLLFSPISYECIKTIDSDTGKDKYKILSDPLSINTLNHIAIPMDSNDSMFYHFVDPDYKYIDDSIMNTIYYNQIKSRMYGKHLINPSNPNIAPLENYFSGITDVRTDSIRLYFVNGYDFGNIYGLYMRITVDGNDKLDGNGYVVESDRLIDLCDILITKSNFYKLCKYSINPTMFGNNIYDRYIEVNIACVWDLINNKYKEDNGTDLYNVLDINDNTNIRLSFAYITEDDMSLSILKYNDYNSGDKEKYPTVDTDLLTLNYTRTSIMNGIIPRSELNSDFLGAYISECPDMPYLMFYATWRDKPLTASTVWSFNKGIRLYDRSLIKDDYDIVVGEDYLPEYDMKKWIVIHEIKCSFCIQDRLIKEERYSMTQIFVNDSDPDKFFYRPIIFDEVTGMYIDNAQIVYTMRLINSHDKVQFVKMATISLYGNMSKYYIKGTSLKISNLTPYKIYNKIIDHKHEHVGNVNGIQKTKYVKLYYSSTEVVLDDQGNVTDGNYNYVLNLSQAPKSYKFTFKKLAPNGSYDYMDLSNGYYKLYFKDDSMNDNLIEPTFSTNMNLYVGELEFNINMTMLNKLQNVSEQDRKMSIVLYNEDGSMSSMFDFLYTV